jgi:tetratricopeptide (TPR) repeat protein
MSLKTNDFFKIRRFLTTSWLLFLFISAYAADSRVFMEKGNKAYADGFYANALELYKEVIKQGYESPDLYYNIGNTCYKLNDLPSAILYYERARKLDPGKEDVNFNLKVANSKIADKIEAVPELFYKRWFTSLTHMWSADRWAKVSIVFLILSLLLGGFYFVSRIIVLRKVGFWLGLVFITLSFIFMFFGYQNYLQIKNQDEAIIFAPTITIKSSPDDKSIDLFVLHEGTKVQLLDHIGNWFEIKIANGSIGWLPSSSIERI